MTDPPGTEWLRKQVLDERSETISIRRRYLIRLQGEEFVVTGAAITQALAVAHTDGPFEKEKKSKRR